MPTDRSSRLLAAPCVASACLVALLALARPGWALDAADEQRRFAALDTNNDGKISQEEFSLNKLAGMFDPKWTAPMMDQPMRITLADSPLRPEMFTILDANGDGILTGGEVVSSPLLSFDVIDTNHDTVIDREEFHAVIVKFFR